MRRLASLAFQCLENDVHCASLIQETEIEIETEIEGERAHKSSTHNNNNRNHNNYNNHNNNSCSENQKWSIMRRSNAKVDEAFSRYFTNLFLRFLPMNTYHYPQVSSSLSLRCKIDVGGSISLYYWCLVSCGVLH